MPDQRQTRSNATRRAILEAARKCFEEDGFEAATIRAVAQRAEVATGTVLLHFSDKATLLAVAFQEDLQGILDTLPTPPGLTLEDLCAVVGRFYDYYALNPALSRILIKESLFPSPATIAAQEHQVARLMQAFADALGDTGKQLAPVMASHYLFALLSHLRGAVFDAGEATAMFRALASTGLNAEARP